MGAAGGHADLEQVLSRGGITCVYQPVVNLETGETVAYEALARGPSGSGLEAPAALFAAARRIGRLDDLDWACRGAAAQGALDAGLGSEIRLLINVEPETLHPGNLQVPEDLRPVLARTTMELSAIAEFTERAISARPAQLLAAAERARSLGFGIAIDDVGALPESLAVMPLLRPDLVKLDLALVQQQATVNIAAIVNAVRAYAEETGATVLAEGIETEDHRQRALGMGASIGQGWLLGKPGPIKKPTKSPTSPIPLLAVGSPSPGATPFQICGAQVPLRRGHASLLNNISWHLENQAAALFSPPIVAASFQTASRFTAKTARRYERLAKNAALVTVLGAGMPEQPAPGVRGTTLRNDEPLVGEWCVCVVGAHYASALVARELDERVAGERAYEYGVTHNRQLVLEVARSLLLRLGPASRINLEPPHAV
jgi:EAL domain-containing protein (putative c-di-GMP-specific phosphodiesterase class I)